MIEYTIIPKAGFTEKIGELVSMLEHTRLVTLNELSNLNQSDLDFLSDPAGNRIGSLLLHIAAIEKIHQLISFENRDFNESEFAEWGPAIELGEKSRHEINANPLSYYITKLSGVREATIHYLQSKDDHWLFEEKRWPNGTPFNNYYLWFHVMEDEINHRGQIRVIKRLLSESCKIQ